MSNFLAIASVTETLKSYLNGEVGASIPGAMATAVRPTGGVSDGLPDPGVNVYLYQALPNNAFRGADLPTRGSDGALVNRPRAALDLHYLLSFYGKDSGLEPQKVMGAVVRALTDRPTLTGTMISDAVENSWPLLDGSDLADAVESVKFTPLPLTLEEMSRVWSVLLQVPYQLSCVYVASVVFVEGDQKPRQPLPVRSRTLQVIPMVRPHIRYVQGLLPPDTVLAAGFPLQKNHTLLVRGSGLRGRSTRVKLCGTEYPVEPQREDEIRLPLDTVATLRAGVLGVQVVHAVTVGTDAHAVRVLDSNVASFVLAPLVLIPAAPVSGNVTAGMDPPVGREQRVNLLLDETKEGEAPRRFVIEAPANNGIADDAVKSTASITFDLTDVADGEYFLRIQVDGVESLLRPDDQGPVILTVRRNP